jgi:hypothetical protein
MSDIKLDVDGPAEVTCSEHIIDLDADPFNPWAKDGWTVEKHQKGGQFKWDASQVVLHLDAEQKNGRVISGYRLREKLAQKSCFNANLLDYLLAHPHLIPKEWKEDENRNTRYIFFWGTVYRSPGGDLYVRYLDQIGRWCPGDIWLDNEWRERSPAALRAS